MTEGVRGENAKMRDQRSFWVGLLIFALALMVRFVYLCESSANPSFEMPLVDSKVYDETARAFAQEGRITEGFFWQPFFYPFFLSLVYSLRGNSIVCAN